MNTTLETRRRVLFVDDDPQFLETMRRVLGGYSRGLWEIQTAENASQALAFLQKKAAHLVVIDVQMPVVDGLQFLTLLNRRYPNLLKVVLTGYATEAYRVACLSNGAELFLEKPKTQAQLESLYATLNELLKFQPEAGFRGVLRRVGLQDVIQMECLGASSSVLQVKTGRQRGKIYIQDGAIVHAEVGEHQGEAAFNHLLALKGGEFSLHPFSEPPQRTIEGQWEFLLMEAARRRDETGGADEAEPESPATVDVAGALPAAEQGAEGPPAAAQEPAPEPLPDRRIDEVLVCSAQGEVLHEWQVRNSDLWINCLEFVSQKARRIAQAFPFGAFDRLEASVNDEHLVILIRDDRGVVVRSHAPPPKPPTIPTAP